MKTVILTNMISNGLNQDEIDLIINEHNNTMLKERFLFKEKDRGNLVIITIF